MAPQTTIIEEHYDTKARIQLDFKSYMKIALLISVGFSLVFTIFILVVSPSGGEGASLENWLIDFIPSILLYFVFGVLGSLIIYPIYRWWCEKRRGQLMSGKFAMIREIEKEKDGQEKSAG